MSQATPASTVPARVATGNRGRRSRVKRASRRLRIGVITLASLALLVVILIIVGVQGAVNGTEFSPTHFQARSFSFYEIPGLQLQITPIRRKVVLIDMARFLRTKGWVTAPPGAAKTWHLMGLKRGLATSEGDASLLTSAFKLTTRGSSYWKEWSKKNTASAQWLWPRVQTLAERELYVFIPPLLELAQRTPKPAELSVQGDALILQQYLDLIRDTREAKQDDLAEAFLLEAEQDFPQEPRLKTLREAK